jgi:hypothetical protein
MGIKVADPGIRLLLSDAASLITGSNLVADGKRPVVG